MTAKPIPDGHHAVTPYLIIDGAAQALDFYKQAFGAEETFRMEAGGGKIAHAQIMLGDSMVMLADEYPHMGYKSPRAYGGTSVSLMLYVADVDATFTRALAAGARELRPVADQFYGDRVGTLADPFGHVWNIATHKEDLTYDEIKLRGQAMMKSC